MSTIFLQTDSWCRNVPRCRFGCTPFSYRIDLVPLPKCLAIYDDKMRNISVVVYRMISYHTTSLRNRSIHHSVNSTVPWCVHHFLTYLLIRIPGAEMCHIAESAVRHFLTELTWYHSQNALRNNGGHSQKSSKFKMKIISVIVYRMEYKMNLMEVRFLKNPLRQMITL